MEISDQCVARYESDAQLAWSWAWSWAWSPCPLLRLSWPEVGDPKESSWIVLLRDWYMHPVSSGFC